ncbi:MAG: hypothetical protein ACREE5_04440 [Acetobacteraceae bacterium]
MDKAIGPGMIGDRAMTAINSVRRDRIAAGPRAWNFRPRDKVFLP